VSVVNNRIVLPAGGGLGASPDHAVIRFATEASGEAVGNQITGCWVDCISVSERAVATIRANAITIPAGSPARHAINGLGGLDPGPGLFADPADAPTLVIEENVIRALGVPADPGAPFTYDLPVGIWLENATATISRNTIERAATGIASMEASDVTSGRDNIIQTTWVAVRTNSIGADDSFDNGRVTLNFSDITDYASAVWSQPGDASSDLTCNFWGAVLGGEPTGFLHDNAPAPTTFVPWATGPVAGTGANSCTGGNGP